jgi:hypothetical protein
MGIRLSGGSNDPDIVTAYNLPEGTKALEVTWAMGDGR